MSTPDGLCMRREGRNFNSPYRRATFTAPVHLTAAMTLPAAFPRRRLTLLDAARLCQTPSRSIVSLRCLFTCSTVAHWLFLPLLM
jgi:hypothetical protein